MKKVIVIGCGAGSKVATDICAQHPNNEIIFYENVNDVPFNERGLNNIEVFKMQIPKKIEFEFMPKAKHCPKGHERPYKFHQ